MIGTVSIYLNLSMPSTDLHYITLALNIIKADDDSKRLLSIFSSFTFSILAFDDTFPQIVDSRLISVVFTLKSTRIVLVLTHAWGLTTATALMNSLSI